MIAPRRRHATSKVGMTERGHSKRCFLSVTLMFLAPAEWIKMARCACMFQNAKRGPIATVHCPHVESVRGTNLHCTPYMHTLSGLLDAPYYSRRDIIFTIQLVAELPYLWQSARQLNGHQNIPCKQIVRYDLARSAAKPRSVACGRCCSQGFTEEWR